mgnify:CR=1 FL=1
MFVFVCVYVFLLKKQKIKHWKKRVKKTTKNSFGIFTRCENNYQTHTHIYTNKNSRYRSMHQWSWCWWWWWWWSTIWKYLVDRVFFQKKKYRRLSSFFRVFFTHFISLLFRNHHHHHQWKCFRLFDCHCLTIFFLFIQIPILTAEHKCTI